LEDEKQRIRFDSSGELGLPRAVIHDGLKLFVNDTVPGLLMYNGRFRDDIRTSIAQSLCWMMSRTWDTLPDRGRAHCDGEGPARLDRVGDDYAFLTHSLGSHITFSANHRRRSWDSCRRSVDRIPRGHASVSCGRPQGVLPTDVADGALQAGGLLPHRWSTCQYDRYRRYWKRSFFRLSTTRAP